MRIFFAYLVAFGFLVGCSGTGPVHMTEVECLESWDCEYGSYCDSFTNLCGWDCRDDAECEPGMYCDTAAGRCLREGMTILPPDTSPVLEITAGPMEDLTVLAGTADAELLRASVTNSSDRWVVIPSISTWVHPLTGFGLGDVLGEMKFRDERSRRILAGPIDLTGVMSATNVVFLEPLMIPPHGELLFAVRADLHDNAETEFDLVLGNDAGALFTDIQYVDGELIPPDRIEGNLTLVRHVNVMPMATMTEGTTVLTVDFRGMPDILIPALGSQNIAQVRIAAHGGGVLYDSIPLTGMNLEAVGQVVLAEAGVTVGGFVRATVSDRLSVPLNDTVFLPDGASRTYDVYVMPDGVPSSRAVFLNVASGMEAEAIDSRTLRVIESNLYGIYQIWANKPVIYGLPVPYASIANGLDQDIFRFQTSSRVPGGSLGVKAYSFAFVGETGGIRNLRVRVGSTLLPRDAYQILYTDSGEVMDEDSFINPFRSGFTVLFRDDLDIVGSGQEITIVGIPSGFDLGDSFTIRFGAQTYGGFGANVTARGTLTRFAGDDVGAVTPVVWTDRVHGGIYNGTWLVHGVVHSQSFTRR